MTAPDLGDTSAPAAGTELADEIVGCQKVLQRLPRAIVDGYRSARPTEQAAFGMISGFAMALIGARKITYVQERRRYLPVLRGLGRALPTMPRSDDIRVHHYLPGFAIAMTTGATAILAGSGGIERWLSLPFGVGVGLVFDELGLLTGRDDPYWGAERFVLISGLIAVSTVAAMTAAMARRGWALGD